MKLLSLAALMCGLLLIFDLSLTSCASISSPAGGPRDTIPPSVDTAFPPNYSINFRSNTIEIVFDEYVTLSSPAQQIRISPPLPNKPEISQKGRRVRIEIADSLLANTTYTISFGTAITDYTESNVRKNFKYVFSTGTFIDSLLVKGKIINAYSAEPQKDLLVGLYELTSDTLNDSLPFLQLPTYYSYVDDNGQFSIENVKYGKFQVFAFEDKLGKFQPSLNNLIAFYADTLQTDTNNTDLLLYSFKSRQKQKFFNARQKAQGLLQINYNRPVQNFSLRSLPSADSSLLWMKNSTDTLAFWFRTPADSLILYLDEATAGRDTAVVQLREMKEEDWVLQLKRNKMRLNDTLRLTSNIPLALQRPEGIWLQAGKDTIKTLSWQEDSDEILILPQSRQPNMNLIVEASSLINWYEKTNDSLNFAVTQARKEDLSSLEFAVSVPDSGQYILQLYQESNVLFRQYIFRNNIELNLKNIFPGTYSALLIEDRDNDGEWSPGDYFDQTQPEKIIRYSEKIDLRANWELELAWEVKGEGKTDPDPAEN